jgi:hypothetical protein
VIPTTKSRVARLRDSLPWKSPIFVIDGGDVMVFRSVAEAEGGTEVQDIDSFRYFDAEGTVLEATADGYRVRLTPSADRRPEELHAQLVAYLRHPRVGIDPVLAKDPHRLAELLVVRQRSQLWPRWPRWLHRLAHRSSPHESVRDVEFGCEYCADDQNRWFGHVTQIGSNEARMMILLRCPRCDALYENAAEGEDRTRRLTENEARQQFPGVL